MKIAAVNGSPRMEQGITDVLLKAFLKGAVQQGATADIFYPSRMSIASCQSDMHCWEKDPGKCIQNDDMIQVLEVFEKADLWVFATPLYFNGMTGTLKTFTDRLLPLGRAETVTKDGMTWHPERNPVPESKLLLISTCGLYEKEHFAPLVHHLESISRNVFRTFSGALLRPHAWVRFPLPDEIIRAAESAGAGLMLNGVINQVDIDAVGCPLLSREVFLRLSNTGREQNYAGN